MQRLLNLILAVAIAVVGWRVYTTWSATPSRTPEVPRSGATAPDLPTTARTPPPARLASMIADRDLFDESRRSPSGKQVAAEEPALPADVALVGVMIAGSEPEALIRETGHGKARQRKVLRHVYKGDDVAGYTVSSITATEVTLTSPGGAEVSLALDLKLREAGGRGKGAASSKTKKKSPAAASNSRAPGAAASGVRERLRELRRKRREANRTRRQPAD